MVTAKSRKVVARKPVAAGPEYVFDDEPVPAPGDPRRGAVRIYFPFGEMELVGPKASFKTHRTMGTLRDAIRRYRKDGKMEEEFKVRERPEGGCRVWRIK